jgi:serine/threonine protein kinase
LQEVEPTLGARYDFARVALTPKPSDAIRIGQVFLDKYRVDSILGQGGMGVVAECMHLQLNERVALKLLRQDVLLDHDAVERFKREGQAAAKLKSEYVARVRDVGELENGTPFMVMEYLDGQDLGVLITERGTLPAPWATELILQTCEALAEAHSYGIVHRDVKPTNLFVTWRPDGTALIKVLDFGISKSAAGTDMHLTQTQSLLGTPAYMSPEQMRSARLVDGRTDIWSLGSVLYELLEGRKPFEAESFSEMCVKVAVDAPTPMERTSFELQQVVLRCLAKTPEARYQSMADLARDLVPFTQDPQSATMLVERMQRMQRRGEGTWEGSTTGVGMRGVPHHVRDVGSAPVARQSSPAMGWHGGSEPASQMFRTPIPGSLGGVPQRYTAQDKSAPAIAPSEFHTIPKAPRRRFGFVLLGIALAGIAAAAIAMNVGGGGKTTEPSANVVEPVKMDEAPAVVPTTTVTPTPTPTPTPTGDDKVVPPDPQPTVATTKTVKTPAIKKPVIKKPVIKKAEIKKDPDPKDTVPVVKPKCDPFASSHARPCS